MSPEPHAAGWVAAGLAVAALAAWWLHLVKPSGALAGWGMGLVFWLWRGSGALAVFAVFAGLGLLATRLPQGVVPAAAEHPARGASHAIANGAVGLCCALLGWWRGEPAASRADAALVAAFAAACADTLGTEVGSRWGRRACALVPWPEPVAPGTAGALSWAGTLAGLAGAACVGVVGAAFSLVKLEALALVAIAALGGTLLDAALGRLLAHGGAPIHHGRNLAGTAVAAIAVWIAGG